MDIKREHGGEMWDELNQSEHREIFMSLSSTVFHGSHMIFIEYGQNSFHHRMKLYKAIKMTTVWPRVSCGFCTRFMTMFMTMFMAMFMTMFMAVFMTVFITSFASSCEVSGWRWPQDAERVMTWTDIPISVFVVSLPSREIEPWLKRLPFPVSDFKMADLPTYD